MKLSSNSDLKELQNAILKDYGLKLEGKELYQAAFNLLHFFEALINFDNEDKKQGGSKAVLGTILK